MKRITLRSASILPGAVRPRSDCPVCFPDPLVPPAIVHSWDYSAECEGSGTGSNIVPVMHFVSPALALPLSAAREHLFLVLPIPSFSDAHPEGPGLLQALRPCICNVRETPLRPSSAPFWQASPCSWPWGRTTESGEQP